MPGPADMDHTGRWRSLAVFIDLHDWWIGYCLGDEHHYVCPLPTLVLRWNRKRPVDAVREVDR